MLVSQVTAGKVRELVAGADGFMVYDMGLVPVMWKVGDNEHYIYP